MSKTRWALIAVLTLSAVSAGACASGTNAPGTATANQPVANSGAHPANDEIPATVKAAFPAAQSITKQHKDIPPDAIADIEKDTGGKVPDQDHHAYLAFANQDGKRTQIGAATIVNADGREIVIVYESKKGMPTIKEVRADGVAADFLKQFAGKGHDDKFQLGADLNAHGVPDAAAKALAQAIRIDAVTMQKLYGAAHTH